MIAAVAGICLIAFVIRFWGLSSNPPFWVDEFSTGTEARIVQAHGPKLIFDSQLRKKVGLEHHNIPAHILVASSFSLFGESERAARLPFVIIGSLIPLLIYVLLASWGAPLAGIIAAILTTHVHLQVLWSVQARGYMLLQACILLAFILYNKILEKKTVGEASWLIALLAGVSLIGLLSHITFVFVLGALMIHSFFHFEGYKKYSLLWGGGVLAILTLLGLSGSLSVIVFFIKNTFSPVNNLWYYHSFMWREYTLVAFLGALGLVRLYQDKKGTMQPILIFIGGYLMFILFIFGHHMTKYLLPIFPFILAGMAYLLVDLGKILSKKSMVTLGISLLLTYLIILNGDVFVNKPDRYYSLNNHFREISNIDYNAVYDIVKAKSTSDTAIIETWPGRALWYTGNDNENMYLYRWENEVGFVNGHEKKTSFYLKDGIKRVAPQMGFVSTQKDLQKVMARHSTGFIFIDDDTLPEGVRKYAEKNLTKELFLDHYTLDPNPYSLWPATLYSWGFLEKK